MGALKVLLRLLVIGVLGSGFCQIIDLGVQDSTSCRFKEQDKVTGSVGASFRATCDQSCTETATQRKNTVFGTDIYHQDSELCVAAIHDARLAHPARWTGPAAVALAVVPHDGDFAESFRRGVRTAHKERDSTKRAFAFTSAKVIEPIPDITVVHEGFRYREGRPTSLEIYVGDSENTDIEIFSSSGAVSRKAQITGADGSTTSVKWLKFGQNSSPGALIIRLTGTLYSDVTTVRYVENPLVKPDRNIYRASVGDRVALTAYPTTNALVAWQKNGVSLNYTAKNYIIDRAEVADAGLYHAQHGGSTHGAAILRLIVRGCPTDLFGTNCDKRCPYCLHGGQCHDVTGVCVCPAGFLGPRCETSCPEAHFGHNCSSECSASSCESSLLCVPDPYGCSCASGWKGIDCKEVCPPQNYGPDCSSSCGRCKGDGGCNRFTGECKYGCEDDRWEPPLCLELSPWFRDPPDVRHTGFTSLRVRQAVWSSDYDNGLGSGHYSYSIEYRLNGTAHQWTQPATKPTQNGNFVAFVLDGLKAGSTYEVRIIIKDFQRNTAMRDEAKVPSVEATTKCEGPLAIENVEVLVITSSSATVAISAVENFKKACAYQFNVSSTLGSSVESRTKTSDTNGGARVNLPDLLPFKNYSIKAFAVNQKGRGPSRTTKFQTAEAAPGKVTEVQARNKSAVDFNITWKDPASPNGIIREYAVDIVHREYAACAQGKRDRQDRISTRTANKFFHASLMHPFSAYSATVKAFTVAFGDETRHDFVTGVQAPSEGVLSVDVLGQQSALTASWSWPDCSHWNDDKEHLRLVVEAVGSSPWNMGYSEETVLSQSDSQVEGLIPFSKYSLRLYLSNSAGRYPKPYVTNVTTLGSVPGKPVKVTITLKTATSINVGWDQPSPPLADITSYVIRYQRQGAYAWTSHDAKRAEACQSTGGHGLQCDVKIPGLEENAHYTFQVYAVSVANGVGERVAVNGTTQEGRPGPPQDIRYLERGTTSLKLSWRSPIQRNGIIRGYQLNISLAATSSEANSDAAPFLRSYNISTDMKEVDAAYVHEERDLNQGRRYLVRVAARTSVGYGNASQQELETLVAPPLIKTRPQLRPDLTTDSTVHLKLTPIADTGGPIPVYFVVVSSDPDFDGTPLTSQTSTLPNADEARDRNLDYYVAAALDAEHVTQNGTFVVGDGSRDNSTGRDFYNKPLETGETYRIGVAVLSKLSEENQRLTFRGIGAPVTVRAPTAIGAIVGILFAVLVVLIVVMVAFILYRRRQLSKWKNDAPQQTAENIRMRPAVEPLALDIYNPPEGPEGPQGEHIYENLKAMQINFSRIALSDLMEAARNTAQLNAQIMSVSSGLARPCDYGRQLPNRTKNRYANLIAYDDSRVILDKMPEDDYSDYINANYVDGYERSEAYIATQGPKLETIFDFWRMVWQKRTERIVMLTNLVEGGKRKCDQYWPEEVPLQLPEMVIIRDSEQVSNDYTIRTFTVVKGDARRTVTQLHYTAWPDHSVPMYPSSLTKFMRELDAIPDGGSPTVVHCSAGVGRTGTVILIDVMHQMGRREQAVDVYSHLVVMRQQRANLCANQHQYKLVHQVLVQLLVAPDTALPATQLAVRLPQLKSVADGPSQLEQQMTFLDTNPPEVSFSSALAEQLQGKNRSPEILPEDKSRVFLQGNLQDNYINAIYVQGFKTPDAFIATEAPLPGRRGKIWQMVTQKQVHTIVVMSDLESEDMFWPAIGEAVTYGNTTVKTKSSSFSGMVEIIVIVWKTFNKDGSMPSKEVRLFRLPAGEVRDDLPSPGTLVQLYSTYARARPENRGRPTVVVCRTGVTLCGLFLACAFVLDRLAEEQEVDVVMAVSVIRQSRPQFIASVKQLELCYDVALAWLEAFEIYSNFQ
ncbi:receptor-type tyrosine-protein phosphatase kappa-like [Pollicipes pollicipes]|uniref:receptor-type tyrosine-protein phosphatase kappa-like n=1 Tax=Pollicipes pollicipes TaxID=41117 RepID=UPI0018857EF6|nr:receptor-type tyrosine-protein phosphatase kappa-like [Pollicipes pollicipes]